MRFFHISLLACFLVTTCGAETQPNDLQDDSAALAPTERAITRIRGGSANVYLDAILESVANYLINEGFNNYTLPDQSIPFSEEFLGIEWTGQLDLSNGFLTGLESIHRAGDSFLIVDGTEDSIALEGTLEFMNLGAGFDAHINFMGIDLEATAAIAVSSVQVSLKARLIMLKANSKSFIIAIDELNIVNPGTVDVEFHGLGSLDFLLDVLGVIIGNGFSDLIFDAVEGPLQEAMLGALGETIDPNAYLDDILASVGDLMVDNGWDTFPLPDQIEGFSVEFLGIDWHAEATLTEGFISGLETIHRKKDIILSINDANDAIVLDATLEFFDFTAGYTMYIGVMGLGIEASVKAIISQVQVELQSSIYITNTTDVTNTTMLARDLLRGADIVIDGLDITNEFFIGIEFDGLGLFDWILDAIGLVVVNIFSGLMFVLVEGPVAEALQEALNEMVPGKLAQAALIANHIQI